MPVTVLSKETNAREMFIALAQGRAKVKISFEQLLPIDFYDKTMKNLKTKLQPQ